MPSVKQGGIKFHFWVFGMNPPGIDPRSSEPLANSLNPRPCIYLLKISAMLNIWYKVSFMQSTADLN